MIEEAHSSNLGAAVFNAYTHLRINLFPFSKRLRVVKAMLKAMLKEEARIREEDANYPMKLNLEDEDGKETSD